MLLYGTLPVIVQLVWLHVAGIRSTPNFVAAQEPYHVRPFTVFRYSLQNDAFVRDFSAPEPVGDSYVYTIGEYKHRSTAIRSLKTLEGQLQSYRKFFGNRG
jgi:hypothetical protein